MDIEQVRDYALSLHPQVSEELFAKEGGMFHRMTELQAASADWTI